MIKEIIITVFYGSITAASFMALLYGEPIEKAVKERKSLKEVLLEDDEI
jgi:hypothetical protein